MTPKTTDFLLFYDTETTGIPDWRHPMTDPCQPHLVQLAACVVNATSRQIVAALNVLIRPEGWIIPPDAIRIHGITNERVMVEGIRLREALAAFQSFWEWPCQKTRIAHNAKFDAAIIEIALRRDGRPLADIYKWNTGSQHCTMRLASSIMKLPGAKEGSYKLPKLSEAFEFFTGRKPDRTHDAMADVETCITCYFEILDYYANQEKIGNLGTPVTE